MGIQARFSHIDGEAPSFLENAGITLASLQDPEAEAMGLRFLEGINNAGCVIRKPAPDNANSQQQQFKSAAVYTPFIYDDVEIEERTHGALHPFVNDITVHENIDDHAKATISISHEGVHGIAWNAAPILHASPYNGENAAKPFIVLCPQDWVRMVALTEQDAFAKQAWIASRAAAINSAFYDATNANPVSAREFENIRANPLDLRTALLMAANTAMETRHHTDKRSGASISFGEYYTQNAVKVYQNSDRLKNPQDLIFVRMDEDDMIRAGNTLGPNIFKNPEISGYANIKKHMSDATQQQLNALSWRLGIYNYEALPTFKDTLAAYGLTPDSFMDISKNAGKEHDPEPTGHHHSAHTFAPAAMM